MRHAPFSASVKSELLSSRRHPGLKSFFYFTNLVSAKHLNALKTSVVKLYTGYGHLGTKPESGHIFAHKHTLDIFR